MTFQFSVIERAKRCVDHGVPASFQEFVALSRHQPSLAVNKYDAHIVEYFKNVQTSSEEKAMSIYAMLFTLYIEQRSTRQNLWHTKRNQRLSLKTAKMLSRLQLKTGVKTINLFLKKFGIEMFSLQLLIVGLRSIERTLLYNVFDAQAEPSFFNDEQFVHENVCNVWSHETYDFELLRKAILFNPEFKDNKKAAICQFMDRKLSPTSLLYKFLAEPTYVRAKSAFEVVKLLATKKNLKWSFNAQGNAFHLLTKMFAMTTLDGRTMESMHKEAQTLLKVVMLLIVKGASKRLWWQEANPIICVNRTPLRCISPMARETLGIHYWGLWFLKTLHLEQGTLSTRMMHFTPLTFKRMLPSTKLSVAVFLMAAEAYRQRNRHGLHNDVLLYILNMLSPTELISYVPSCDYHEECNAFHYNEIVLPSMRLKKTSGFEDEWSFLE